MAFRFPDFADLCCARTQGRWEATFDSYDQRNEDVYYWLTPHEASAGEEIVVRVGLYWAGADWTTPHFRLTLEARLLDALNRSC